MRGLDLKHFKDILGKRCLFQKVMITFPKKYQWLYGFFPFTIWVCFLGFVAPNVLRLMIFLNLLDVLVTMQLSELDSERGR